jgi:hypothetical protein
MGDEEQEVDPDDEKYWVKVFVTGVSGKLGGKHDSARPSGHDQKVDQKPETGDSK